jgi:hypothetical protein
MRISRAMGVFATLLAVVALCSCGGGSSSSAVTTGTGQDMASVFTVGTDASLPSVVSCQVMVTGVTIFNGTTNVPVLTTAQVVDFAQLSGLHQLLDLNAVPPGTYSSATVTISSPVIGFIDTTKTPPAISMVNGTLSSSSVTVNFATPFVVANADLVGLRMEFDLAQSLVTSGGQITGAVNPVFHMQLLGAADANVSIDDFRAGVVAVTGANTFIVQGPKGRQWTVQTNTSTVVDDPTIPVSSFTTNTIVEVSGQIDAVTKNIDASEIEVVSNDGFALAGLFTSIRPAAPQPATAADLFIRSELPDITGIQDGQITTLTLNNTEVYRIANINNPITTLLFNNSALVPGQSVGVGGKLVTTNGVSTLTVHRVVLRRQGQAGTWVPGSTTVQSGNSGSFQLTDNWTDGVLLPAPLPVLTTNATNFIGLSGLSALTGAQPIPIRVVGFILFNSSTSAPVMVARSVEELTD